jgi:hypothetical protein
MTGTLVCLKRSIILAAICGFSTLVSTARGQGLPIQQETDLLDQTKRLERVAAQKAESEIRMALRQAERLAATDAAKAVAQLKQELARLGDANSLPIERRQVLERVFKDRIRVIESGGSRGPALNEGQVQQALRRAQQDRWDAERNRLRQGLGNVSALQKDGKIEQASREASRIRAENPQDLSAQAAERAATRIDELDKAHQLARERERSTAAAMVDIDRSSTPAGHDMEFPADWKEKTKNRSTALKLTDKEKDILRALKTPVTVNFKNSRLETVLDYFYTLTGQQIVLDQQGLRDAEVTYDTPVTINLKNVSLRFALRKVLADLGLAYVVKEENIQVTSAARAREIMVVRGYYIGDLLAGMAAINTNLLPNPYAPFAQQQANAQNQAVEMMKYVKELMEMIENSVDSHTWQRNGGFGTITFNAPTMSLIIKQSAEVHAQLGNSGLIK